MKHSLSNLSIVFTVRVDSQERLQNILATLEYYDKYTYCPLILLEADTISKLGILLVKRFKTLAHVFIFDKNPFFHRTHYINEEFRLVKSQHAAVIDSDVIVPVEQLIEANKLLTETDNIMVYPYDGRFVSHGACLSNQFRKTITPDTLDYADIMPGFTSVGGAFLVNVERYREFGWENENFPGWGPEDAEREHRLDILGHKPARVIGKIHHLYHPRGINSSDSHETLALATKREYCKVCAMMPNELQLYISTWPWIAK